MAVSFRCLGVSLAALLAFAPAPAESPGPGGRPRLHASTGERILGPERATAGSDDGRWEVEAESTTGDPTTIETRTVLHLREDGRRVRRERLDVAVARCAVSNDGLVAVAAFGRFDLLRERDVPCFVLGFLPQGGELRIARLVRLPVRDGSTVYDAPEPRDLVFVGDLLLLHTQVMAPEGARRELHWYDGEGERLATWDTESLAPEGATWSFPHGTTTIPAYDVVVTLWGIGERFPCRWAVRVDSVVDLPRTRTAHPEPVLLEEIDDERGASLTFVGAGDERRVRVLVREDWSDPTTTYEIRAFGQGEARMRKVDDAADE